MYIDRKEPVGFLDERRQRFVILYMQQGPKGTLEEKHKG